MKQLKETFSLTAISDLSLPRTDRLPSLKSSGMPRRLSSVAETPQKPPSLVRNRTEGNLSHPISSVIKEMLSDIRTKSQKKIHTAIISDQLSLARSVKKLEESASVRSALDILREHVLGKKTLFNKYHSQKNRLLEEIAMLQQKLSDVTHKERLKSDNLIMYEALKKKSEDISLRITKEKQYTENLRHMINTRKDQILSILNPTREIRKEIREANVKTKNLKNLTEYHEKQVLVLGDELEKAQEGLNNEKEKSRFHLNQERKFFQHHTEALAFYKESQEIWYRMKKLKKKEQEIQDYEALEQACLAQVNSIELKDLAEKELAAKEAKISEALQQTSAASLNDLGKRIEKLKDNRDDLLKQESELENALSKHSQVTSELNRELDALTIDKQIKCTQDHQNMYTLEETLLRKEKNTEQLALAFEAAKKNTSAVVLSLNRLIQKISDETGDPAIQSIKGIQEAIQYLKQKIRQISI